MTNLVSWLLESASDGNTPVVWASGRWSTYGQLTTRLRQVAACVRTRAAGGERPIIPILGENSFEYVAAYLGVLYSGAVPAPLAPLSDSALGEVLAELRAPLILAEPKHEERLRQLGVGAVVPLDLPLTEEAHAPFPVDPAALSVVLYTSGSTKRPRGVMLSSDNLRFNTEAILGFLPLTAADRALVTLPLYYCYGLSVLHTHLRRGASVVLENRGYPEVLLELLGETSATGLPGVPGLFQMLVTRSALADRQLPSLRYVMVSGGRPGERLLEGIRAALPRARVYVRYGVTELTAAASCLLPEQLEERWGSIGRGLAEAPLAVEHEDGSPVRPGTGEIGEIVVGGRHVALGYFQDPEETARCFKDGRFHTGDLARVDADGYVFIVGRSRDFVKTAGHRVSPHEVEDVIARLADVEEVAVFGVPHEARGEALAAVVVARHGRSLCAEAVQRHCRAALPAFKVPVEVRIVDALPQRANGKLDRRALPALRGLA